MLRKSVSISALLLLVAPLTVLIATGQDSPQQSPPMPFTVAGKIVKVEGGKITLGTEDNIVFYVVFDDKTQILLADGSAGKNSDLHEGVQINVKGDLDEKGNVVAKKIQIETEKTGGGQNP